MVDVSEEEVVNGAIPVASELVPGRGIPPVGVEAAVGEHCQFREDIELSGIKVSVNGVDKALFRMADRKCNLHNWTSLKGEGKPLTIHSQITYQARRYSIMNGNRRSLSTQGNSCRRCERGMPCSFMSRQ